MKLNNKTGWLMLFVIVPFTLMACVLTSLLDIGSSAEATPTPTQIGGAVVTQSSENASRCENLAGSLELQLLVGPSDAVGLEPVAVGTIPFAVTTAQKPYLVEGSGFVNYEDVLTADWGTYTVTFDMDVTVQGDCSGESGGEQLNLVMEMTGDQYVEVVAEGFHGEYPWSGTQTRELAFPLEEGASAEGEGWAVILHLSQ